MYQSQCVCMYGRVISEYSYQCCTLCDIFQINSCTCVDLNTIHQLLLYMFMYVCMQKVCMSACVCAFVRAYVRAMCVSECVCVHVC